MISRLVLIITILLSAGALKANITVTNVDTLLESLANMSYELDLDNDGTGDYSIEAYYVGPINNFDTYADIKMLSPNSEMVSLPIWPSTTVYSVDPMDSGDVFHNYFLSNSTYVFHKTLYTNLSSTFNNYIALRLLKGGNYYYGWVRLDVSYWGAAVSVVLKDYAFEDIPNRIITAGQTISDPVSVIEFKNEDSFSIYPNPVKNTLTINPLNNKVLTTVKVYNSTGVLVKNIKQQDLQIDVSDLANGIYFVELIADNSRTIRKVVK
ncbi:MAG: T9SS type A sorting domain-containing protein [Vicingaceae bacterium]